MVLEARTQWKLTNKYGNKKKETGKNEIQMGLKYPIYIFYICIEIKYKIFNNHNKLLLETKQNKTKQKHNSVPTGSWSFFDIDFRIRIIEEVLLIDRWMEEKFLVFYFISLGL